MHRLHLFADNSEFKEKSLQDNDISVFFYLSSSVFLLIATMDYHLHKTVVFLLDGCDSDSE